MHFLWERPQPKLHLVHQTLSLSLSCSLSCPKSFFSFASVLSKPAILIAPQERMPITESGVLTREPLKAWSNLLLVSVDSTQLPVSSHCCQACLTLTSLLSFHSHPSLNKISSLKIHGRIQSYQLIVWHEKAFRSISVYKWFLSPLTVQSQGFF